MKSDPQSNPLGIVYDEIQSEDAYIKLKCCDCDYTECKIAKKYISNNSKEGCVRKVSEENATKFYHYVKEIMPFWKIHRADYIKKSYIEIINFLYDNIYSAPITQRLDPRGKVRVSGY